MKILGITGSSGSGKTTVSEILRKKKINVIDSDKVAKELTRPGTAYMKKIVENFGAEIIMQDGELNRKKLASMIYNDEKALEKLNNLTFYYVVEEIKKRVEALKKDGKELVGIDAPLLFESKLDKYCDYIIAVTCTEKVKIDRICKRDKISEDMAKQRLKIQHEDSYYKEKSDFVIVNNENSEENLAKLVEEILTKIEL